MKNTCDSSLTSLLSHKKTILLITITVAVTLIISSMILVWLDGWINLKIPSTGTIRLRGVEGYWDKNLTNKTETCDWGTIWPGVTENRTIYLRSICNFDTTLNLTTGNWTYLDSNDNIVSGPNSTTPYMNLTWNYNYTMIKPGQTLQVTLTLSVDRSSNLIEFLIANDVKRFSVDIYISTSG
jgi:hypothetical protein